jgi:hypothetical protein
MIYKNYEIEIDKENDRIRMILLSNPAENVSFSFAHFSLKTTDDNDIIEAMIQEWLDSREEI